MKQISETYRRGLAERKAWLAEHPGKTWRDAAEAWTAKRLAETAQTPAATRTPVRETAPVVPVSEPPAAPLHTLSNSDFAAQANEYWNATFRDLHGSRPAAGSPFFAGWNAPLAAGKAPANQ